MRLFNVAAPPITAPTLEPGGSIAAAGECLPVLSLSLSKSGKGCEETADGHEACTRSCLGKQQNASKNHKKAKDDRKNAHASPCRDNQRSTPRLADTD